MSLDDESIAQKEWHCTKPRGIRGEPIGGDASCTASLLKFENGGFEEVSKFVHNIDS